MGSDRHFFSDSTVQWLNRSMIQWPDLPYSSSCAASTAVTISAL
jgi:hypothetical protein